MQCPDRQRRHLGPLVALATTIAMLVAACGADEDSDGAALFIDDGAVLLVANSPGTVSINGPQRLMVALVGEQPNTFFGDVELPATLSFTSPEGGEPLTTTADYLATDGVALGLYVTEVEFDTVGRWTAQLVGSDAPEATAEFEVATDSLVPEPGDPAPTSDTPTAVTAEEVTAISTDLEPDLAFYDLTIAEAVTNGRPTVIAFATPAFCLTALCGPTLDTIKDIVGDDDAIDVVHVEPYDIEEASAGSLNPVPTMFEWQLVSEPWVFVVNENGSIAASFEGTIGADELQEAVDALP